MENTNCGCDCAFVKAGFCKTDKECPFYTETWWQNGKDQSTKLVCDCSPKRQVLGQNSIENRVLCLQESNEQVRNRMDNLENALNQLIAQSQMFLRQMMEERPQINQSGEKPKEIEG